MADTVIREVLFHDFASVPNLNLSGMAHTLHRLPLRSLSSRDPFPDSSDGSQWVVVRPLSSYPLVMSGSSPQPPSTMRPRLPLRNSERSNTFWPRTLITISSCVSGSPPLVIRMSLDPLRLTRLILRKQLNGKRTIPRPK